MSDVTGHVEMPRPESSSTSQSDCDTPFQFYARHPPGKKEEELMEFLKLISFIDTAIKNMSVLISSKVTIQLKECQQAMGSEDNLNYMKEKKDICGDGPCLEERDPSEPMTFKEKLYYILIRHLISSMAVKAIVSESHSEIVPGNMECGRYVAYINALDKTLEGKQKCAGGTTFAFVRYSEEEMKRCRQELSEEDVVFPFGRLEFGGLALYGYRTQLVIAVTGHGVQNFTLDPDLRLFTINARDIRIPRTAYFYSGDGANSPKWPHQIQAYLDMRNSMYPLRYFWPGGYLQPLWAILQKGGIYFAPVSLQLKVEVAVLSVAYPIALIMQEGGGICFPINHGLREHGFSKLKPQTLHQTTGLCFGSYNDAELLKSIYLEKVYISKDYFTRWFLLLFLDNKINNDKGNNTILMPDNNNIED